MQYQVPQFIEVEDKIVGPLSVKQFIYVAGAIGLCVVFVVYLPLFIALLLGAPVLALGLSLAFYKVNGKPFVQVLEAGFNYYTGAKFYLWHHQDRAPKPTAAAEAAHAAMQGTAPKAPRLTRDRLSEIALALDTRSESSPEHASGVGAHPNAV